ncbi:MAG: helix-turn-helix transcriptional regulator [Patescibacteria group bacterium]
MKQNKSLAKKIKKARKSANLSQKDMGKALKLSDKAISAYEVGRAEPSVGMLKKISKITKTPFQYFVDEMPEDDAQLRSKLLLIEEELKKVKALLNKRA